MTSNGSMRCGRFIRYASAVALFAYASLALALPQRASIEEKRKSRFMFFQETLDERARERSIKYIGNLFSAPVSIGDCKVYADSGLVEMFDVKFHAPTNSPLGTFREPVFTAKKLLLNADGDLFGDTAKTIVDLEIHGATIVFEGAPFGTGFDASFEIIAQGAEKETASNPPPKKRATIEHFLLKDSRAVAIRPGEKPFSAPIKNLELNDIGKQDGGLAKFNSSLTILTEVREHAFNALSKVEPTAEEGEIPVLGFSR